MAVLAYDSIVVLRDCMADAVHDIESSFARDGSGQEVTLEKVRLLRQWLGGLRGQCPVAIDLLEDELESFPDRYASHGEHTNNPALAELSEKELFACLKDVRDVAVNEHRAMVALHQHMAGHIQTAIRKSVIVDRYTKDMATAKIWMTRMRLASESRESLARIRDALARLEQPLDKSAGPSRLDRTECEQLGVRH